VFLVEESEGQKENLNNLFFISNEKIDLNNENFIEQKINEKDIEWYFTLSKDDEASEKETTEQIDIYADNNADNSQEPC
jgi:hypothetical protein